MARIIIPYETLRTLNPGKQRNLSLVEAQRNEANSRRGWWENFNGSEKPIDTDWLIVICTNLLGGSADTTACYQLLYPNSTRHGPMSIHLYRQQYGVNAFPLFRYPLPSHSSTPGCTRPLAPILYRHAPYPATSPHSRHS